MLLLTPGEKSISCVLHSGSWTSALVVILHLSGRSLQWGGRNGYYSNLLASNPCSNGQFYFCFSLGLVAWHSCHLFCFFHCKRGSGPGTQGALPSLMPRNLGLARGQAGGGGKPQVLTTRGLWSSPEQAVLGCFSSTLCLNPGAMYQFASKPVFWWWWLSLFFCAHTRPHLWQFF